MRCLGFIVLRRRLGLEFSRDFEGNPKQGIQENTRNILGIYDPCRYILIKFLLFSCGFLFGVPIKVP